MNFCAEITNSGEWVVQVQCCEIFVQCGREMPPVGMMMGKYINIILLLFWMFKRILVVDLFR